MATNAYDVSSRGFKAHTTANNVDPNMVTVTTGDTAIVGANAQQDTFSASAINLDVILILFILGCIAVNYIKPQILCFREFWKNCFRRKCWWRPPREWMFDLIWFIMDGFYSFVMIHYLYLRRNPPAGTQANFYAAIFGLFIFYLALRWWWIVTFWNFHHRSVALGLSIFFALFAMLALVTVTVLLAIQGDWWAFGFSIPVDIWMLFCLIWTIVVYRCFSCNKCQPYYGPCPTVCPTPEVPLCPVNVGQQRK